MVYKVKIKSNGSFERYKYSLIVRGFTQEYDTNYEEIFALVVHLTYVRSLLVVPASKHWDVW